MPSTPRTARYRSQEGGSSAARVADLGSRPKSTRPLARACARLCRLAARALDVPAVAIALQDGGRPFLAGSIGLEGTDPDRWWGDTPLSVAISDQVSAERGALRVDDLAARELLAADPLHREHGFRALLAIPLDPGSASIGSLCAFAREPRVWTDRDVDILKAIGESVMTEIQLRGSVRQVRSTSKATRKATRRSFIGLIDSFDAAVHERDAAEAAGERIRAIIESITEAFVGVDHEHRITFVNSAGERLLGGPSRELIGQALADKLPAGAEAAIAACAGASASGEATELAVHLTDEDSWLEVRIFPSSEGLSLYLHDATLRRRAEEQMRASETRYRFLADSIPQQIWTADSRGKLEYVNRVVVDYTGVRFEQMLTEGWTAVIHPDEVAAAAKRWDEAVARAKPFELEARLRNAAGEHRWHLCRARCQTSADGAVIRWFGANTDIHDQKELEAARDQALDDLERVTHLLSSERTNLELQARELRRFARALKKSNEDLDRFAYVASHDLKAPLRGIANLSEWLVDDIGDKLNDETKQYATLLQNRVQRMEALIDGILQYSRAGRSRDAPELIDVGELVRDAIELLDPPAHFEVRMGTFWPTIRIERTPLQQVFMNLIGNAIKHANGESPVIEVRMRDEGEDFCEFSVSDNGPGIAPQYHERIFMIFQTLRARDEVEGTGIGLSVVKRTVENQGGQVWVESEVGKGATFCFLWPRDPDAKERTLG
jgi:PAS domain S-box-containing protein